MANPDFSNVFFNSISEIGAKLRAKEFSAVELTRAYCDRLERLGPGYNALALSLRKQALKKAKEVDGYIKLDRTRHPLLGIPYGAKDLLAVNGQITAWGAKPYASQVFSYDATVIEKLNSAGAILIGKMAMVELAGGGGYRFPSASVTGAGRNPWDRSRWSGGSSSGSAAATAAGLVPFALGSETSGSILTPAAFCGVTGLRPTYGLVSRHGAMALSWTLDKIGPLCRSAEDCALVLQTISGPDEEDRGSAGKGFYYNSQYTRKPKDLTLGYAPVDFDEWADPSARAAFHTALDVIKSHGYKLKEVEIPDFPYGSMVSVIIGAEAASIFEELIRSGQVDQLADHRQAAGLKSGLETPAVEYLRAMRVRTEVQGAFRKMFSEVDLLLTPSRLGPAPKLEDPLDGSNRAGSGAPQPPRPKSRGLSGLIPAGNLAGLPAISLPCGFANDLPLGISFVSRPFYENQLIQAGKLYQSQTDWHRRAPRVES
jgi:aspartyl-tRNA(Asn)/glutamyl-tRNA(Gln) amidotransferase subunit A